MSVKPKTLKLKTNAKKSVQPVPVQIVSEQPIEGEELSDEQALIIAS